MKKAKFLLLPCLSLLAAISLHSQNAPVLNNENNDDQNISPLMMFGGDVEESPTEKATDPRKAQDQRVTTTPTAASSQTLRGTLGGGITEATVPLSEEEDENAYLENEICENIYTACLARVADMTLGKIPLPGGNSVEASVRAEWEAAQEMANEEEEDCKRALEEATKEKQAAERRLDSSNARDHGKAYVDEAYYDFQVKEVAEALAKAKVQTAHATRIAFKVKGTMQSEPAEIRLQTAVAEECKAAKALEEAIANGTPSKKSTVIMISSPIRQFSASQETPNIISLRVSDKAAAAHSEESFLDEHTIPVTQGRVTAINQAGDNSPLSKPPKPLKPEDKKAIIAKKEIEAAEAALEKAETAHNAARRTKKAKAGKITLEKEQEIYMAAEEAWTDAELAYDDAISKAKKASLNLIKIEQLTKTLKETTANAAEWSAHGLQVEAKKLEQNVPAVGSIEETQAKTIEIAWTKAMKACQEAIEKAQTAGIIDEIEELTDLLNSAQSKKEYWIVAIAQLRTEASQANIREAAACEAAKKVQEEEERVKAEHRTREEAAIKAALETRANTEKKIIQWRASKIECNDKRNVANEAGKEIEGTAWNAAGNGYSNAAEKLEKAIESEKNNNFYLAQKWRDAAALYEQSVNFYIQAIRAYVLGKETEGISFNNTGNALCNAVEKLEKALDAEASGKTPEVARAWYEAATLQQKSIESYAQATRAHAEGKEKEETSWNNAGLSFYNASEKLEKAIKAETAGKPVSAKVYHDAVLQYQLAAENFSKSANEYAGATSLNNGRVNVDILPNTGFIKVIHDASIKYKLAPKTINIGKSTAFSNNETIYGDSLFNDGVLAKAEADRLVAIEEISPTQEKARVQAEIRVREEAELKAAEEAEAALSLRNHLLYNSAKEAQSNIEKQITQWIAAQIECNDKRDIANKAGKEIEGEAWNNAGIGYYNAVEKLRNVLAIKAAGKSEQLAKEWEAAAALQQQSVESYIKAAKAYAVGEETEGKVWNNAGLSFYNAVEKFSNVLEAGNKALEAEAAGTPSLAATWREIAALQQQSVESYTKSAKAYASGKEEEAISWNNTVNGFSSVVEKLEKAIEVELTDKSPDVARTWREAATLQQQSIDCNIKAAKAKVARKTEEGKSWYNAEISFALAAEKLKTAIEADVAGKPVMAKTYHDATLKYQHAAENFSKSANKYETANLFNNGKTQAASVFNDGLAAKAEADKLVEAEEIVIAQEKARILAREEARANKEKKLTQWRANQAKYNTNRLYSAAEKLGKAIEAELEGKSAEAQKWSDAATLQQQSSEFYNQSSRAYEQGQTEVASNWDNAGSGFYNAAEKLGKAIEAEVAGKSAEAQKWSDAAALQQRSTEFFTHAASAHTAGKTDEGENWHNAGTACYNAVENLEKAIKTEAAGKSAEAVKRRDIAGLFQQSIEPYTQSARAYAAKKINEGKIWRNAGIGFDLAAEKLKKAIEFEVAGKVAIAQKYSEAAEKQQQSIQPYIKAARAYAIGKTDEGESWNNVGNSFCNAAEKLEAAIVEEEAEKPVVAQKYREAAAQYQHATESFEAAAGAYSTANSFNSGKKSGEHLNGKGNSTKAEADRLVEVAKRLKNEMNVIIQWREAQTEYDAKSETVRGSGKKTEEELYNNISGGFRNAAEKLGKSIGAEAVGKSAEAKKWSEAASLQQQLVEPFTQAAKAYEQGKIEESNSWSKAGHGLYNAAEKLGQAIDAEAAGKPIIAKLYREAAVIQQQSVEPYTQAARAYAAGKTSEGSSWNNAGNAFYNVAEKQVKAIEVEVEGKKTVVVKAYREAAVIQQQSMEPYIQAARAYEQGKIEEGNNYNNIGHGFYNAANNLEKALEAESSAKPTELARAYREVAALQQQSCEPLIQAIKAHTAGKIEESVSCNQAGQAFYNAADKLGKAIEAEAAEKPEVAAKWREAAVLQQQSLEPYNQAAKAYKTKKIEEGNTWNMIGNGLYNAAESQVKIIEAEAAEKPLLAQKWSEVVELYRRSNERYTQLTRARITEKIKKYGNSWNNTGTGYYNAANNLEKAIEADQRERTEVAELWRQAAEENKKAIEFFIEAARAKATASLLNNGQKERARLTDIGNEWIDKAKQTARDAEKWSENRNLALEAKAIKTKDYYLMQGRKAQEVGKTALAEGYGKAAETLQRAAEQHRQSASAYSLGKISEGRNLDSGSTSLRSMAYYQVQASEAQEEEKTELAADYQEAATVSQLAAEQYQQSSQAFAIGNENESIRLWQAGQATQEQADSIAQRAKERK